MLLYGSYMSVLTAQTLPYWRCGSEILAVSPWLNLQSMKRSIELRRNKYARDREAMSAPWRNGGSTGIRSFTCNHESKWIFDRLVQHSFTVVVFLFIPCMKVDSRGTKGWDCMSLLIFQNALILDSYSSHVLKSFASDLRINEASMPNLHSPNARGQRAL